MDFRIAVVTPYYEESLDVLKQCHESVVAQRANVDHIMVADGFPNPMVDSWSVHHVRLPRAHADNGNTPRSVGSLLAQAEGYDFIAYLDADNWYHPDHLQSLIETHELTKSPVCCSQRTFHRVDGSQLPITEVAEDSGAHVDTSCFLIHRDAFAICTIWHRIPRPLSPICDRIFFMALRKARFSVANTKRRTVAFRSQYAVHYLAATEDPPPASKTTADVFEGCRNYLLSAQGVKETVASLGFWPAVDYDLFN